MSTDTAKAVVRRNTEEVQSRGNFDVFEELFATDFVDHTPQPGTTPDKAGVRKLYSSIRAAFPDFHAEIHRQLADGDRVTTYKTYYGTHEGHLLGVAPTHQRIQFETVDVMRVRGGKITDHWGVGNLLSLMRQIGGWTPPPEAQATNEEATRLLAQIKSTRQTPATTHAHEFLVSLTPETIQWERLFEGAEIAVVSGDPGDPGSPYVIRIRHRDGLEVPPHRHSFDENITVVSGAWVMGLGERFDLSAAQEFPAESLLVVPKRVPHFALCEGETIVQGHFIGPFDTTFVRPEDDPRKKAEQITVPLADRTV
jgi:steroid delta-isomerase-like uncharacterized protein